jgi:hypothetical protein
MIKWAGNVARRAEKRLPCRTWFGNVEETHRMEDQDVDDTGSKSFCAPDDYNTESYKQCSDFFAADREGQGDKRLTPTPSVIPKSNYVIMVGD